MWKNVSRFVILIYQLEKNPQKLGIGLEIFLKNLT